MNEKNTLNREVIKDLSNEFNSKVNAILEEIDEIKISLINDKKNIVHLNDRIHALFCKLYPKIVKSVDGENKVKIQYKYHNVFEKNKSRIWKLKRDENGELIEKFNNNYYKFRLFVERRELHLNKILEDIGLTAKEKIKGKRLR